MLEGTVIAEGAPIPGANLALLRRDVLLTEAQTDGRGRFRLESSPLASAGTLRVTARGFVSTERSLAAKPAGGTMMLGNLRLLRANLLIARRQPRDLQLSRELARACHLDGLVGPRFVELRARDTADLELRLVAPELFGCLPFGRLRLGEQRPDDIHFGIAATHPQVREVLKTFHEERARSTIEAMTKKKGK